MHANPASFAMLSHRGKLRRSNEDACGARAEMGAFVVCDGMGGAAAGEVASHLAADVFLTSLSEADAGKAGAEKNGAAKNGTAKNGAGLTDAGLATQPVGARVAGRSSHAASSRSAHAAVASADPDRRDPDPQKRLEAAICAANRAVYQGSQRSRQLRGMGTTLVALLLDGPGLWLAHVGDSRGYRLRGGTLTQLTEDHSLVEEQIRAGLISRMQANSSPIRNIITRAIGSQATVEPEVRHHETRPGDLFLLASDGLTRELEDEEIGEVLAETLERQGSDTLEAACQALVDTANARGGRDNITVLLLRIP
jgi:PPM family protein phosphatase